MTEQSHSESAHMDQVDRVPYGPTEPDEAAVLGKYLPYDPETGTYSVVVGDDQ
jgi:hypothetical protein